MIGATKKRRKELDEDNGAEFFRNISTYDIDNALHDDHLPLSDNIHGPYKMMPPDIWKWTDHVHV